MTWASASALNELSYNGPGSGFALTLPSDSLSAAQGTISSLKNASWTDDATQFVMIEFSLFNGNLNRYCGVNLAAEFIPQGDVFTTTSVFSDVVFPNVSPLGQLQTASEIVVCLCVAAQIVWVVRYLRAKGAARYFESILHWFDVIRLLIFVAIVGVRIGWLVTFYSLDLSPGPSAF